MTVLIVLPTGLQAQETGAQGAGEPMSMPMPAPSQAAEAQSVAAPATTGPKSATLPNLEDRSGWPEPTADSANFSFLVTELLEYRESRAAGAIRWDIYGWYGGDVNRLWVKTEGLQDVSGPGGGEQEAQLLYGRLISPFFDLQAGIRFAHRSGPGPNQSRTYAAIGVQGIAPYRYSLEPTLFISQDGKVSLRATATYDQQLTQRLILQPRFEFDVAVQKDRSFGVGSGLNKTELGLRLRYEVKREFAPYVGVSWTQSYGSTKRLARAEGEDTSLVSIVAGVRMWF
ncbi:copper resistance protein B [Novosphingobium sp. CCH12-A3]|uniref:copper resistance protein B n=1 Tax=Novosphingobium sp. CCH12-A3 TaxID=1768752 RepID=UPI000786798B|nr:copper resistance protein B [Novosphingobium sp. CCH12-A3]